MGIIIGSTNQDIDLERIHGQIRLSIALSGNSSIIR
jgi:hypothetical protein